MSSKKALVMTSGKSILSLIVVAFLVLAFLIPPYQADAAEGLVLSTRFPGISAVAGENITFPLEVRNNGSISRIVNLEVSAKPVGWNATLKGSGRVVQQVFAGSNDYTLLDLLVKIPQEAKPGEYSLTVSAKAENSSLQDNLKLKITITDARVSDDELTAKYTELKGPSDAHFTFKVELTNNGSNEEIYSLGAQTPAGWQVSFKPTYEDQQVASIPIKPGEKKSLDVTIKPPVAISTGRYTIPVEAISPTSRITEDLTIIISGSYDLDFSPPSGRLSTDIIAGREKKVTLEAKNTGSADLNNIHFTSNEPVGWSVTFEPKEIETLKPGESRQVTATISADDKALAGDYLVSLAATTQEVRGLADMRVTVKTSTLWGIIGLLIILAVLFIVYKAFQIYGRR